MNREEAVERMSVLLNRIERILKKRRDNSGTIESFLLVATVLTSGALWALLSGKLPEETLWVSAIVSTLTTGLVVYQATLGPKRAYEAATDLFRESNQELAHIRGAQSVDVQRFWDTYKRIEAKVIDLEPKSA